MKQLLTYILVLLVGLLSPTTALASTFYYPFSSVGVLKEAGSMSESTSPYWWLNSGGLFYVNGGTGGTIQGELPVGSEWQVKYKAANPVDTDNGLHPQNLLRLVTKGKWQDLRQEVDFKINKYNVSESPNRNQSNGVLLFNRYQDGDNLYYTGIRVDGYAVVKKKKNGTYYTMATKTVFPGTYNIASNPNLIPVGKWIGLRSEVRNNPDGTVQIKVFMDKDNVGNWQLLLDAKDNGSSYGGAAITNGGYAGIRTDFMDVMFDEYKIIDL